MNTRRLKRWAGILLPLILTVVVGFGAQPDLLSRLIVEISQRRVAQVEFMKRPDLPEDWQASLEEVLRYTEWLESRWPAAASEPLPDSLKTAGTIARHHVLQCLVKGAWTPLTCEQQLRWMPADFWGAPEDDLGAMTVSYNAMLSFLQCLATAEESEIDGEIAALEVGPQTIRSIMFQTGLDQLVDIRFLEVLCALHERHFDQERFVSQVATRAQNHALPGYPISDAESETFAKDIMRDYGQLGVYYETLWHRNRRLFHERIVNAGDRLLSNESGVKISADTFCVGRLLDARNRLGESSDYKGDLVREVRELMTPRTVKELEGRGARFLTGVELSADEQLLLGLFAEYCEL